MRNKIPWSEIRKSYGGGTEASESPNPFRRRKVEDYLQPETAETAETEDEFSFLDALSAGTGRFMEHVGTGIDEALRPDSMTPSEWKKRQPDALRTVVETLQDEGNAMFERNHHQYEDNSVPYHLQNIFESVPESAAILGGSWVAGNRFGGVLGSIFNTGLKGIEMFPRGLSMVEKLYRAYNASNPAAKVARTIMPQNARALTSAEMGAGMEAYVEGLEARKRYIENAKANGTYVEGDSERKADEVMRNVIRDNIGIISAFNIPQYNMLFGKGAKSLLGKAGRLAAAAGTEGGEEVAQELASAYELGEPVDSRTLRDAFIAGAGMGTGFHAVGRGIGYVGDRISGRPSDEEIERLEQARSETLKKLSDLIAKTETDDEGNTRYADGSIYGDYRRDFSDKSQGEQPRGGYVGEGGKGENVTWIRQHDGVSFDKAQPGLLDAVDMLAKWFYDKTGKKLVVTSGNDGHSHTAGEHDHYQGWKVDVNDWDNISDGYLVTADGSKGSLTDEFIAYGRNLGLGMNWEGDHIDVTLDGTQWDGNGDHAGGFNPQKGSTSAPSQRNAYDPNFSDRQNRIWQAAQHAAAYANEKYGMNLQPDWLYRQLAHEAGSNFDSNPELAANHNYGGLKGGKKAIGEDARGHKYFANDDDFFEAYVDEFIGLRPELKEAKSLEDFARIMKETGYYRDSYENYVADMKGVQVPNAGRSSGQSADATGMESWDDYLKERMQPRQEEPPMQARQIDFKATDDETKSVFDGFAKERANKAIADGDGETALFFRDMFNGDEFQNTEENRAAIAERYGDDLAQFAQTFTPALSQATEQTQTVSVSAPRPQAQPAAGGTANKYIRGDNNVIQAGNNFLEELRAKGTQADAETVVRLLTALQNNDTDTVRNVLEANNRPIAVQQPQQQAQPQNDPVKQNGTPENVLAQQQQQQESAQQQQSTKPKKQPKTPEERAQATLAKPLQSKKSETRRKAGNAVIFLADKNGIEISDADRKSLGNGKTAVVNQWRDILIGKGILSPQTTQPPPKQSSPAQSQAQQQTQETAQPAEKSLTLQERMQQVVNKAGQQSWDGIQDQYRERANATWAQRVQEREDEIRTRQKEAEAREEELRTRQVEQEEIARRRSQEEYERAVQEKQERERQAKQEKELQELQTRQEAEKRAAEDSARRTAEQDREIAQRQSLPSDIAAALAPPSLSKNALKKQGNAIADLINSTPFKDMFGVISLPSGLEPALRNGNEKAINAARNILSRRGVRPVEWTQQEAEIISKDTETPAPYEPPQQTVGRHEETVITHETPDRPPQIELDSALTAEPVAHDKAKRKRQGEAIHRVINSPQFIATYGRVKLPAALESTLQRGEYKAIETVQRMLRERGIIPQPEEQPIQETQPEQETKPKEETTDVPLKETMPEIESTSAEEKAREAEEREARKAELAEEEEEVLDGMGRERDQNWLSETEDENTEWVIGERERLDNARKAEEEKARDERVARLEEEEQSTSQKEESPANPEEEQKQKEPTTEEKAEEEQKQKEPTDVSSKETKPAEAKTEEKPKTEPKSMEGEADTRITNVIEDESTLTPFQKLLKSFSEKLGVPLKFFRNPDGKFHGSFSKGVLFLNVNSKKGLSGVFWHESFHWLKANNPKLYAKLVDAAGITDAQRAEYLDRTGRKDLKTNEGIDEEILADQMDDVAKRTGLFQSIAGKNRGVVERVVQWLKDTMNKFIETFRNPTGRLTTKQAQALAKEFGQIARQLKDENGEQIFRVNNRTGGIEVVEGRKARELSKEEIESAAKSPNAKYSVSDTIKNFASTVFNGKPQSKNHKQFIVDKLEELTRYKTYFNTNDKNEADVIVDSFQKIIRARHAYEFEKLLPAAGEPIAKVLGLNPSAEMSNYIADWMMTGAINNTSKEATAFQKAMRAHPAEAELLQSIRDTFQEMANMTAEEAVESNIVRDKKSKTFREWLGEKFSKEQWVDDLHPIKRAYDQMLAKAPPAVADIIKKNFDPYMSASLFRGKGAIVDMMIGDKKEVTAEDIDIVRRVLQHEFPNVDFSSFKPLAVTAKMVDYDVEGLERYALAKLDKEMHEKKNSGDAKYANLTPSYTEAQCDEIINAGKAKYDAAHRALVDYSNFLTAIQYSTGVISASQFYQRVNGWKNFVPTARVFEEYEDISVDKSDSSKHKTGSKRRVYAPLGKLEDNTNLFIRQALQNRTRLEIVTMARLGNFGDIIAETPKGYPHGHTIHFKENGKMKYLVTPDESLARAVEAIQTPADANIVVQAFKTAGMIMRGLYTMWNFEFAAGNPFRDLADAFIHNKYGSRNPFVAIPAMVSAAVSGFAQSVGAQIKSEEFRTFLAEGGAQSGFSYEITEGASRRVNSFGKKSLAKSTWDKFLMIAEASENMTRFSTFKTAKDNLAKQHGGVATPHDLKLAAMQARRATVDFARAGRTMRGVNKVLLFSNAAMQSLALWGEKINAARKSKEGRQELFAAVFKTVMGGVMPALAFAALNFSDDERRKRFEQRPTWEKDTYWIFGDGLRVPKGMDLGIKLTSALTEEFAMWIASNKPVEWKRIIRNIRQGLPSITTTIFTPAVESYFNYSIFKDAPIVPYGQQDDAKYKQYGKNTSWVAKQLGNMFNQSPRQIDHLIAGYGGSMLTALTGGSDGKPIVRRFMFDPDKNPRIVQDYYKALEEQEEMFVEYKARRADGEKVELPEDYDRGLHARLKKSREAMTKISKAEMRIMDDPKLDADTREEKLRELEKRRVALCERVLGKAR